MLINPAMIIKCINMEYKCVYCKKTGQRDEDFNREHVIPRFLGKFQPVNPVLIGIVCAECNAKFSKMERKFKADSTAGILCQMLNLEEKPKIRVHNNRVKNAFSYKLENGLFNGQFPNLKADKGEIKFYPTNQVVINDKQGGYTVVLPDLMKKQNKKNKNYERLVEDIKNKYAERSGVSIFAEAKSEKDSSRLDEIIKWLKEEFDIEYKEIERVHNEHAREEKRGLEVNQDITVDHEIGAVLAKMAFNYLSYSAQAGGEADKLFSPNFDKIKAFVSGDKNIELKSIITKISDDPILEEERGGMRFIVFYITFKEDDGKIVARISFFGREVFDVVIGDIPAEWKRPDFGSGHAFDPFKHQILSLSQMRPTVPMTEASPKFGLFRRLITQP